MCKDRVTEKPALQNKMASNGRIKQLYWSLVRGWFRTWNVRTCNRVKDIATDRYMINVFKMWPSSNVWERH
jgi:hypothetical protein